MLKREIKSKLNKMKTGDHITFCTQDHEGRTQTIAKTAEGFTSFSRGQGWFDRTPNECDFEQALKWVWSDRPKAYYWDN